MVTAYTLAFGGLLLLGGRIADYVGRKRMFIIGLLGFAGASALGGVAVNAAMLFGARALQGAFAALLAPAALSLITVTFTEVKERATAFGVYGGISGGGAAIGLIIGGVLTEYASWRWCLLVNVPIAILAGAGGRADRPGEQGPRQHQLRHPRRHHRHLGLVALVYGFTKAAQTAGGRRHPGLPGHRPWSCWPPSYHRAPVQEPPAAHAGHPRAQPGRLVPGSFMVGSGLLGMFLFLTFYFQGNLGYSALKTGFAFLPFSAGIIVAAGASRQAPPAGRTAAVMVAGFGAAALGMLWLTQIGRAHQLRWPTCCRPRS